MSRVASDISDREYARRKNETSAMRYGWPDYRTFLSNDFSNFMRLERNPRGCGDVALEIILKEDNQGVANDKSDF